MSEVTIPLKKKITAHGAEITSITLREPEGEDVELCGYPLAIDGSRVIPQAASVSKLISRLAGIPPSSVKRLGMADYNAAMGAVLGFFGNTDGQASP